MSTKRIQSLFLGFCFSLLCMSAWADQFDNCAAIPVPVPAFSCKDGFVVPKEVVGSKCRHPEDLYNRCVVDSRLGVLSRGKGNTGVDIVFSCRKNLKMMQAGMSPAQFQWSGTADENALSFYDIAVIQYDRATGKTCFYQWLADDPAKEIKLADRMPAPATSDGKKFWGAFNRLSICTDCHSNNPFIRTPHYNLKGADVFGGGVDSLYEINGVTFRYADSILPDIDDTQKYVPLNSNNDLRWVSKKDGNACTGCHSIGARRVGDRYEIGDINFVASGAHASLLGVASPTVFGYDDFMVDRVRRYLKNDCIAGSDGTCEAWRREYAKAQIADLEKCLTSPTLAGCVIIKDSTNETVNAPSKIMLEGRPAAPSSMDGFRLMKRYGLQNEGACLSPVEFVDQHTAQRVILVKSVNCSSTVQNYAQTWHYDRISGQFRHAQHSGKCLAVAPFYRDAGWQKTSFDYFEGSTPEYEYNSRIILADCSSRGDLLTAFDWIQVGRLESRQKKGLCLTSGDFFVPDRQGLGDNNGYVSSCQRVDNGSFWFFTKALTKGAVSEP